MNSFFSKRMHAFTLIELLVVIAIIAILAAILFPVFARARENGRRASCQSNLKQLGTSMMMYSQDYDEFLIPGWIGASAPQYNANAKTWLDMVQPYVKNWQIFSCPSESKSPGTPYPLQALRNSLGMSSIPMHYGYNVYVGGGPYYGGADYQVGKILGFKNMSIVANPSRTVMMTDAGRIPPWSSSSAQQPNNVPAGSPAEMWAYRVMRDDKGMDYTGGLTVIPGSSLVDDLGFSAPAARHLGTINVLWVDGHVKAMKAENIMMLTQVTATTTSKNSCFNTAVGCLD